MHVAQKASPPSITEMAAAIRADRGESEGKSEASKGAPEAPTQDAGDADEAEQGAPGAAKSTESDDEAGDEAKADEPTKADDGKPKRPSKIHKLKSRLAEREKEMNEWRLVAHQFKAQIEAERARTETLLERARGAGIQEDPRDLRVAELERKLREQEQAQELAKHAATEAQKRQLEDYVSDKAQEFTENAYALAAKHPGLTPQKLLNAFAAAAETDESVTMDEVAETLSTLAARRTGNIARAQVQEPPPRSIKPGRGAKPEYPPTVDGMAAFLRSMER